MKRIFNAGFIGVNKEGEPAMDWWATICEYQCINAPDQGLFVDQAYLNMMPIYFDEVKVIRHKGCNIANWNQIECKRSLTKDSRVLINNRYDLVFIHFTNSTIKGIQNGEDALLKPSLQEYLNSLEKHKRWVSRILNKNEI